MNELVHRFGPDLHRLIGRLTAWSPDSDDILQEVYLTAWRKAGTYRADGPLEGWLRRLAVNRCRNHRRMRTAFERLLRRFAGRQRSTTNSPGTLGDDESGRLQTAIAQLASEDRTVLALYYLEDLSGAEVADALGVTVPTMHVRLHRARRRLRELLEESEI
jgi:RNA polymerase sigma-70 factor (ECF subfamily)